MVFYSDTFIDMKKATYQKKKIDMKKAYLIQIVSEAGLLLPLF